MKRNHSIEVKVSAEELSSIKSKSDMLGLSMAAFVRIVAMNAKLEKLKKELQN